MASGNVAANWGSLILRGVNPTENEIGVGAYGRVFEIDYEGTLCAAKEVHALLLQYAKGNDLQKIKDDFLSECQIWSTLRHPCVVQFLGVYYPAMDQYRLPIMVMEKMQQSLRDLVEKYDNIPLNVKLSILDEVCLGLRYLHSRNPPIVHRDLTPNNILLSYRLEAKITDLGVAKVVKSDNQKTMTKLPGTPDFMPPEALSIRPVYGPSLDVFSYGGVILNVTTQLWPQPADRTQLNPDTDVWEVVSEAKRRQEYLDKMTGGATDLKSLVISCLSDSPKNRPPVAEVSMTIKRVKDVCSEKSSRDGMSPIVWWAEVSNEQQSQVTSLLTTALEEMRRENDVLKTDNTQLRTNNDAMKDENEQLRTEIDMAKDENKQLKTNNDKQKDEIRQLTTLLDKMAVNNQSQIQQINSQSSEIATIKNENIQLKAEVHQLKHLKESTTPGDLFSGPMNIKWEEGAPAPVPNAAHNAVWLNGMVYVGGGWEKVRSYDIKCYDPVKNSWSSPINTPCCSFAMTMLNNKLLIAGGVDKSHNTTNQILTMDAGKISNYTKMKTARSCATATGHQGMLIIIGGLGYSGPLSSTELFDSNNRQWYKCNDLPKSYAYYRLKSVIVNNTLYVLGGFHESDFDSSQTVFTAPLDTLSRHQLKWNTLQDTPWCGSAPVSVYGTHLLIVGGYKKIGDYNHICTSDVYKLNNDWEAIGEIPLARDLAAAVSTADNKMIIIGGRKDGGAYTNTVWIGSCVPH